MHLIHPTDCLPLVDVISLVVVVVVAGHQHGVEVGLIDFQWTGYGLPGTDVAYCIATCVADDMPLGDGTAVDAVRTRVVLLLTPGLYRRQGAYLLCICIV